jgi:hypothetical protein
MAKFTDNKGDDWLVEVTVFHADRCRGDVEVKLTDALVGVEKDGSLDQTNLLVQLDGDDSLLVSVLYSLCQDQVKERNLTPDDFARRFAGDITHKAYAALVEALLAFFRKPIQREMLQTVLRVMEQGQTMLLARWKTAAPQIESLAHQALDRQVDVELKNLRARFGMGTSIDSSTAPAAS